MARRWGKGESIRPATLGNTALAHLRLYVWCKACRHQVEIATHAIEALADPHGAETTLEDWAARLRCSECGSREVDFVVSGARR
jgi:Zn finger protein HypA/HybF involved in hydrogenase expression